MLKVLIIDDDTLTRKGIQALMPWAEHDMEIVGEASNGKAALEFLEDHYADVALVDLDMPVMDGLPSIRNLNIYKMSCVLALLIILLKPGLTRKIFTRFWSVSTQA